MFHQAAMTKAKGHLLISLIHNTCQHKSSLVSLLESKIQQVLKTYTWPLIPVVTQCYVQLRNTVGKGLKSLMYGVGSTVFCSILCVHFSLL